jgi:ribosomal protein S18 acetylase RimI-like enzyme
MKKNIHIILLYYSLIVHATYTMSQDNKKNIFYKNLGLLTYDIASTPDKHVARLNSPENERLGTMEFSKKVSKSVFKPALSNMLKIPDDQHMHIYSLRIEEEYRKQGLGRLMVNELKNIARKEKILYITLESDTEAIPFWEKLGFFKVTNAEAYSRNLMRMDFDKNSE